MKYYNTDTEVMLGDHIEYRTLFFRKLRGVAVYVPGQSPLHSELESNGTKQWVVKLENGKHIAMLFPMQQPFANPRVLFLRRGSVEGKIEPDDVLR
jgi:hypothetical protein